MALQLTMTCAEYDRSRPLIDGTVQARDIDLAIHVNSDDRSRQRDIRDGKFDIGEFFTGIYMADLEHRTLGLTAIPIFVKRMFRHSYIYVNKHSGIRTPQDLHGKRVGLQTWFTTTALWARGILADDYGVDLSKICWVANWNEKIGNWQPPSWLQLEIAPPGAKLHDLLIAGKIDAGITTETWAPFGHPDIDFLIPNYRRRGARLLSQDRLLSDPAYSCHQKRGVGKAALGGHEHVRRLAIGEAGVLSLARAAKSSHDRFVVPLALGRGAGCRGRRSVPMGI